MTGIQGRGREHRYILLSQCLQNDFFFNDECHLVLPQRVIQQMLLLKEDASTGVQRRVDGKRLDRGSLGVFLAASVGQALDGRRSSDPLHIVHIRDWHKPSLIYDLERRSYGPHCEPGTWGAAYLEGLERYLDPRRSPTDQMARFYAEQQARIYHIHSESVFDFKPQSGQPDSIEAKHLPSQLEQIMDVLIQGEGGDIDQLGEALDHETPDWQALQRVADDVNGRRSSEKGPVAHIAVIGVYTDIKVLTLLAGLRTRYEIPNLAVSDSLTASATLERHLDGLDFAAKVLGVEVVHGLNELVRYLGGSPAIENEVAIVSRQPYSRYATFFQDKQNVLAYQDEKLTQYLALTERRSVDLYERIKRANQFLIWFGSFFLLLTVIAALLNAIWPDRFDWKLPLITGGVSLLQLIGAFYTKPIQDLQQNLTNLARFKMILESHSLKMALARFHLTTPQALREIESAAEAEEAARQVQALRDQVAAIQAYDQSDFNSLTGLGFGILGAAGEDGDGNSPLSAPIEKATTEG
jgi:hypothetical protein